MTSAPRPVEQTPAPHLRPVGSTRGESSTDDWRVDAACVGSDLELFFPLGDQAHHNAQSAKAKQVCGRCPVMATCRAWALKVGPEFGIFGGLTAHERRLVREGRWNGVAPRQRAVSKAS